MKALAKSEFATSTASEFGETKKVEFGESKVRP